MKMSGVVNYDISEVFNIFMKNAKRDFKGFTEENAVGCKMIRNVTTGGRNPIRCTIEITGYVKDKKYEITTSNAYSKCVSTYTFKQQTNGTTIITLQERQSTEKLIQLFTLWMQRLLARQRFKMSFKNIISGINNELRRYHENLERSNPAKEKAE